MQSQDLRALLRQGTPFAAVAQENNPLGGNSVSMPLSVMQPCIALPFVTMHASHWPDIKPWVDSDWRFLSPVGLLAGPVAQERAVGARGGV